MNASELKLKTKSELQQDLLSLTRAQFSLRMQVATQQMTKTSEIRNIRRDIARIKTVMTQKDVQS